MTAIRVIGLLTLAATVADFLRDRSLVAGVAIGLSLLLVIMLVVAPIAGEPVDVQPQQPRENDDTIAKFSQDLKDRLLAGPYRSVTAFADNYALTGVSRSTTYAAISGTRLPTDGTVDKLLATVVGADKAEIETWLTRRSALDIVPADEQHGGRPGARSALRSVRLRDAAVIMVGIAIVAAGAATAVTMSMTHRSTTSADPPPTSATSSSTSTSTRPCSPVPDLRPHQVVAHIANTQGEGTYARITPQVACHTGFLTDGDSITVVCQDLHGPVITDVYDGAVRGWPVWDKLGSGSYVSDLYVDLPKGTAPALVDQLPGC